MQFKFSIIKYPILACYNCFEAINLSYLSHKKMAGNLHEISKNHANHIKKIY